jgi:hypothetical protein
MRIGEQQVEYAGRLTVEDSRGKRFQIHEYRGWSMFKPVRRFVLETGELVKRLDFDTYQVTRTGEKLVRIDR